MVEEVFKNLVDQFSDPFTCLRELVQNAMDAGSEQIEIKTIYLSDPGGVCLEVRDYGEGMNRDLIDGKLTRLFSSSKEDDLTKIGKFGIGFVSVFSLKPDLVIVDTGRDGEYWRIAFDGGTDFQLFQLHQPIEGTSVRLYKLLPYEELEEFEERAKETVSRWCRHSHVDLFFNGEKVNQPLEVSSACRVEVKDPLGLFSVGLTNEFPTSYGFYNSGLTLNEGKQETLPGVTFKVLSNHLEHTLTRDAVLQDQNYEKVTKRLLAIVADQLFDQLCQEMCSVDPEARDKTAEVAGSYLRNRYPELSRTQLKQPFMNDLFGNPVSLKQLAHCAKEETRFFAGGRKTVLAERATREEIPILDIDPEGPTADLLSSLFEVPVVALEKSLAVSRIVERPPGLKSIASDMRALLKQGRIFVSSVVAVEYPDSVAPAGSPPCTFALGADRLVRRFRKGFWATKYLLPQQLLLDIHHPLVRKALSRAEHPAGRRLAVYALCKSALLNDGIAPSTENQLLKVMLERG
ncbi:MAG: ATP-binding protein [Vulcanimicrobiota bacterium]